MSNLSERLKNPTIAGLLGLLVGMIFGLIWGYWIDPVNYINTEVKSLRQDLRDDYLRMTIDSFGRNGDTALALERYQRLGDSGEETLGNVQNNRLNLDEKTLIAFTQLVDASKPPVNAPTEGAASGGGSSSTLLIVAFIGLLGAVGVGAALYLLFFRKKPVSIEDMTPAQQARALSRQTEVVDYEAMGQAPPTSQFVTTYVLKDDLFDDSFSIDSPSGEFLGECGVGISETIGVGDPKKVTAFEVWLFDKNDIQTVTKVLMSANAFNDLATRQRLAEKGEPVLMEPQRQVVLETQTLQLVATVSDVAYGDGPLPPSSYFDRMTLELAVWQKENL